MLKNFSIRQRVMLGFGVVILAQIIGFIFIENQVNAMNERVEASLKASTKIEAAFTITDSIADIRLAVRDGLLANSPSDVGKYQAITTESLQRLTAAANTIERLATPEVKTLLSGATTALPNYAQGLTQLFDRLKAGDFAGAQLIQTNTLRQIGGGIQEQINTLAGIIKQEDIADKKLLLGVAERIKWLQIIQITIISLIAIAVGYGVYTLLATGFGRLNQHIQRLAEGDFTHRLKADGQDEVAVMSRSLDTLVDKLTLMLQAVQSSASTVSAAAAQIAASSHQVSGSVNSQQHAIDQIVVAMNDSTRTVSDVEKRVREIATNAQQISGQAGQADEVMLQLGKTAGTISSITSVIQDISNQTNLLSLNASIEAARAGEQGRGFAVVANEVRKLASTTHQSVNEIKAMISSLQTHATEAQEAITQIASAIAGNTTQVQSVSSATSQQYAAIEEVSATVKSFSEQIQTTNQALGEATQATNALAAEANRLEQQVKVFRLH